MTYLEVQGAITFFNEQYAKAKQQHPALPTPEEFDAEWNSLEFVGKEQFYPSSIVRFLRWHMMQGINSWAGYLHGFILPNQQNAASMEEYNYLNDKEKKQIVDILNWIMYRNRQMNLLQLHEDDDKSAQFVVDTFKEWKHQKPVIKAILEKNMDAWKAKLGK
jgi:hypothetical protein